MASPRLGSLLFVALLVGCGSVASNAGDGGADHASGSAGAAAGATGAAGATAGSTGSAGATGAAGAMAGSTGAAGAGGAGGATADRCEQDADCNSGVCWQQLDGARACFPLTMPPTLQSCQFGGTPCCMADADCTDKPHGRCVPRNYISGCGGAIPVGNTCLYDECATDTDCKATMPAGATVAICLPAIQGRVTKICTYGICRTHADCKKHPGGLCVYGLGPSHGKCALVDELFCAYPSDPCPATACPSPMQCVPNDDYQGQQCGPGPPQYP